MEQDPRVSSGHCKFLRVKEEEGSNVCPLLKQEINMWFFHVLPGPDLISPTLTWGAHSNGRTGSSWLWSCPLPQHWPQPDWGSVWQGRVGHTHEEHVWAPTAKDNSLHAARETSTSRGFAFTDIPSQKQPIQRLINGCFIDTVFFCTGTWSRSTTLEPFPSTFTEKFTDTWPMCLSPNGLQNTAKPHQNISRSRPKFKYGTFYKVITIPKHLQRLQSNKGDCVVHCPQTPICEQVQQPRNGSIAVMARNSKFKSRKCPCSRNACFGCCKPPWNVHNLQPVQFFCTH